MTGTALILGATGGIGGEAAAVLLRRGWTVRALARDPVSAARRWGDGPAPAWIGGDAMREADVVAAAEGASVIVHGVNPPGYKDWETLVLPMLDNTIAAAKASGARVVLPGNVYVYGPDVFPVVRDGAPQNPRTRKGAIRAEMERRLEAAVDAGVRSLNVRCGDFFGARAANSWFSQALVKPGRVPRSVLDPAKPGVGHQWAYLPDVAETMARLLEVEDRLEPCASFGMDGHWDPDGRRMRAAIAAAVGHPVKRRAFPWPLVSLAAPMVPFFREIKEMRYLWREPVRLDNARLVGVLGAEPHTPLDVAVRTTLAALGCLPGTGR